MTKRMDIDFVSFDSRGTGEGMRLIRRLNRRTRRWVGATFQELLLRGATAVALVVGNAVPVCAAPTGAAMPWDAPLTTILDNLQGTVARVLITIAVVLTGLLFAFGEAGGAFKKVFGIAFGGALALGALTFLSALGFTGATF
ncbi:MAG TPA: conjugal transfer protein TrbC [Deltaproteobacteria bacterium]|nr:conjugal transfer protein TrbC [Deltaproteobacteria bacterium]